MRWPLGAAACCVLALFLGCGAPPRLVDDTAAKAVATPARPTRGTLRLRNESDRRVCYVYLRRHGDGSAVPPARDRDALGFEEIVEPRSERQFELARGEYAVRLADCDATPVYEAEHVSVGSGLSVLEFR
ncbi:MAG: hypothetical protein KC417_16530 [Myxococcales bacterium]|nr:hypothetical protein [Myxococcales bacterium]